MGNQLIILGCVGSFNPQLTTELVKFLSERGLEIQHASNRYDGLTHFAVGTGADLAAAFESAEIKTAFVEVTATEATSIEPITLQTVLDAVNEGRKEVQAFFKYEKKSDKAKDGEVEGGKKRGKKNEGGGAPTAEPKPEDEQKSIVDPVIGPAPAAAAAGDDAADEQATQEADADPDKEAPEQEQTQPSEGSDGNTAA